MNSLNSFLIGGNLNTDPFRQADGSVTFGIESQRYLNQDDEKKSEVSLLDIKAWNKTSNICLKTLSKGRGVRVVGRISAVSGNDWYVLGESVEFKPKFDKA